MNDNEVWEIGGVLTNTKNEGVDPRTKIIQLLLTGMLIITVHALYGMIIHCIVLVGFMYFLGMKQTSFKIFLLISVLFLGNIVLKRQLLVVSEDGLLIWVVAIRSLILTLFKTLPVLIMGAIMVQTIQISEFIVALRKMYLPNAMVLPLVVGIRFVPTLRQEVGYIKMAMKIRGIPMNLWHMVTRPGLTFEYISVPILMRSLKIADEMSASALTRGLNKYKETTSLYKIKFKRVDWAYGMVMVLYSLLLLVIL